MKGKEWKMAVALFLAFTMLVTSAPANFYASVDTAKPEMEKVTDVAFEAENVKKNANSATSGTLGLNDCFEWTYDVATKTITITGEGEGIKIYEEKWPMSEAEHYMFIECKFDDDLDALFWRNTIVKSVQFMNCNTTNVTDMKRMFEGCTNLMKLDISCFDTRNVTDMCYMFAECNNLTSLDVSGFNTRKVTDMSFMFDECNNLTSLDVSGFDTRNVTNMRSMFGDCNNLTALDVSGFDTSNVTNMWSMFASCYNLTSLDVSGFDTRNVTNMWYMFYYCCDLTSLDVSGFDTRNVYGMSYMFYNCYNLTSLDVSGFDIRNVSDMDYMFAECNNLTSLDVSGFDTADVDDMSYMFAGCNNLTSLDVSGFDTADVDDMSYMFAGCNNLTSLDVSRFDTADVENMTSMFAGCNNLTSLDVSGFDTEDVENMSYMFSGCNNLTSLDVSGFNTANVTDMGRMFFSCSNLTSLDASGFDTRNVTDMSRMFYACSNLTSLDVSGFDTTKVEIMPSIFAGCSKLTTLDASSFNTENVIKDDDVRSMISGCTNLQVFYTPKKMRSRQVIDVPYMTFYTPTGDVILAVCTVEHCGMKLTRYAGPTNYTITYELNGGKNNSSNPATYDKNTATITLKNPTRTGYTFEGWYSDSGYKTKVTEIKKGSTGNKTFYVKWTAHKYNIAFKGNGATSGTMSTLKNRTYGKSYTLTKNVFKKKNYTFVGWNTKEDGSGKTYKNEASVKNLSSKDGATVTLYAQWKKPKYSITYKLDGGTNHKENPTSYYSTSATKELKKATKKGYTFKGWYSDSKHKTKVTEIKKGSKGDMTLYARWAANKYTIKFKGNGETKGSMEPMRDKSYGKSYKLNALKFEKKGYEFTGWNTKEDGSGKTYKNKESVKNLSSKDGATVTLYAQWKKIKYTISYELKDGTNHKDNPKSYYVTSATKKLQKPTKKGYTFKGWYSDSKYKTKVTEIKKGSIGNKKLYAKWSANEYDIVFKGNGATSGKMSNLKDRTYGESYTLSSNTYKRKGYTFTGWNTKADGSGKTYANKASVKNLSTENGAKVTLYAQWEKTKYTITYKLDGGTNHKDNPTSYYITTSTKKLQNPIKDGYAFKGWYSDSTYNTKVTEIPKGSTGSKKFYAKWSENKYNITFDGNGATGGSMSKLTGRVYGQAYTLPANKFVKADYEFAGWNTKPDGTGKAYADKASVKNLVTENGGTITLYAQWKRFNGERLADIALGECKDEIRIQEGNWATNVGGNYNKYNNYNGQNWCAYFVVWCAKEAGIGEDVIPVDYGCTSMYNKLVNRLNAKVVKTPQKGDLVFYYDASNGGYSHVGIMTSETDSVQGNVWYNGTSYLQKMKVNHYLGNYQYVYVRPNY